MTGKELLNGVWENEDWEIMMVKKEGEYYKAECNSYGLMLSKDPKKVLKMIEENGFEFIAWKTDDPERWIDY